MKNHKRMGKNMGKRSSRRIAFSLLLAGLLLAGLLPVAGIAQNDSEKEVIVSFDMPVTELTVPFGTKIADIPLPETLAAVLKEGTAADIPITWETDGYNRESAGTYLFTADIDTWVYPQARPVAVVTVIPPGRNISGMLWLDKNGDGIKDADETGIAGYPVTLYAKDNLTDAVWDTSTKEDGTYRFEDMEPGSYVVKVASGVIGETEYLLPRTIANDNKFEMDEEAAASWSASLEIGEDTEISGIDAGMLLPVGIKLRNLTVMVDNFDDLRDFFWPLLGDGAIVIIANDIEFTSPLKVTKNNITIKAPDGADSVKLTSKTGRHFIVPEGSDVALSFENIVLDGGGKAGGIEIEKKGGLTLSGAEIMNCFAVNGGAIFAKTDDGNKHSSLTLSDCKIYKNIATENGGGIYFSGGSQITLSDCIFYGNTAVERGGGIYVETTPCTIENCEIYENWAQRVTEAYGGGGAYLSSSAFTIHNSRIYKNKSASWGGGLFIFAIGDSAIDGSDIYENEAIDGGGIYAATIKYPDVSNLAVNNSNIYDNKASNSGGGIYSGFPFKGMYEDTLINITGNTKISGNTADRDGGGVYVCNGMFIMESGENSGNEAAGDGGGIYTSDIKSLCVLPDVSFYDNKARIDAKPLLDMALSHPEIAFTKSSSVYDHPLNNYDINVLVVTAYYVDYNGNSIREPARYAALTGETFNLPKEEISIIPGYIGWRQNKNSQLLEVPVTLHNVVSNSSVYLVYERVNVTISSAVSGDYADKTRDFTFTVKIKDAGGYPLKGEFVYTGGILTGSMTSPPDNGTLILDSDGGAIFTLHHGQMITIDGVPAKGIVWIEVESVSGYTSAWRDGTSSLVKGSSTGDIILNGVGRTIAFTNTYEDVVPAGIRTDDTGALLLAGVSILLFAVSLICRRRKKEGLNR